MPSDPQPPLSTSRWPRTPRRRSAGTGARVTPLLLLAALLLAAMPALGQERSAAEAPRPIRLEIELEGLSWPAFEAVPFRVVLRDLENRPAASAAAREILVESRFEGGGAAGSAEPERRRLALRLPAGASDARGLMDLGAFAGIVELAVSSPGLLGDQVLLQVTPVAAGGGDDLPRLDLRPAPAEGGSPPPDAGPRAGETAMAVRAAEDGGEQGSRDPASGDRQSGDRQSVDRQSGDRDPADVPGGDGAREELPALLRARDWDVRFPEEALPVPRMPFPWEPSEAPTRLELRRRPARPLLANGSEAATLYGFLDRPAPAGVTYRLSLFADGGSLEPEEMVIGPGEAMGSIELTARQAGSIQVEPVALVPQLPEIHPDLLVVDFQPPVVDLRALASPGRIDLGESAEIIVQLLGPGGRPAATEVERRVSLSLLDGRGDLEPGTVQLVPGDFEARIRLVPRAVGTFRVRASSPGLTSVMVPVEVGYDWLLAAIAVLGGLAGALVSWGHDPARKRRQSRWWRHRLALRLFTGVVAGLLLLWAVSASGLLAPVVVGNRLGVFALTAVGGWLGAVVFQWISKLLGAPTEPAPG